MTQVLTSTPPTYHCTDLFYLFDSLGELGCVDEGFKSRNKEGDFREGEQEPIALAKLRGVRMPTNCCYLQKIRMLAQEA